MIRKKNPERIFQDTVPRLAEPSTTAVYDLVDDALLVENDANSLMDIQVLERHAKQMLLMERLEGPERGAGGMRDVESREAVVQK